MSEELRAFLKKNKLCYVKDHEWLTDIPKNLTETFEIYSLPLGKSVAELADEFYESQNLKKVQELHKSDGGGNFTSLTFEGQHERVAVVIYRRFPQFVTVGRSKGSYPLQIVANTPSRKS